MIGKMILIAAGIITGIAIGSMNDHWFSQGRIREDNQRLRMTERPSKTIEKRAKLVENRRSMASYLIIRPINQSQPE